MLALKTRVLIPVTVGSRYEYELLKLIAAQNN